MLGPGVQTVQQPIRMPATTTDVIVDARQSGVFLVFYTADGCVEVNLGGDMIRGLKALRRCKQLLAQRKK